jgi:hypothetical protein
MFLLAKVVQAIGVADVGFALYVGLTETHGMARELRLMGFGLVIFYLGRLLERGAAKR